MANILKGAAVERTIRYKGGLLQIDDGVDTHQIKFAKEFEAQFNDEFVDEDIIDDGAPVFSQKTDRIGNFRLFMKNVIDMIDAPAVPTDQETLSYWITQIADGEFPTLKFIKLYKAPKSAGNKFARLRITCRIKDVKMSTLDDVAVDEAEILGEITSIDTPTFRREAT